MFAIQNINLLINGKTKNEVLKNISLFAYQLNYVNNYQKLYKAFLKREQEVSTGFEDGFAIPHARADFIIKPQILYCRLKQPVNWFSLDRKLTKNFFVLLVPNQVSDLQVQYLKKISQLLLNEKIRFTLKNSNDKHELFKLINYHLTLKPKTENLISSNLNNKKIIAICACPTGIAHTYMAREKLENAATQLGYQIKIETQGAIVENVLNENDILNADYVIIACDIQINKAKFHNKIVYETSTIHAIRNPFEVIKSVLIAPVYFNNNFQSQALDVSKTFNKVSKQKQKELKKLMLNSKKLYLKNYKINISEIKKLKKVLKSKINLFNKEVNQSLKLDQTNLTLKYKTEFKTKVIKIKIEINKIKKDKTNQANQKRLDYYSQIATLSQEYSKKLQQILYNQKLTEIKKDFDQQILKYQDNIKNAYLFYQKSFLNYDQTKNKTWIKAIFSSIGYIIPLIICGGLFIAFGSLFTTIKVDFLTGKQIWITPPFFEAMKHVGSGILNLIPAFLAMYIAYAINNKPALAPAFIGGMMISNSSIMKALLLFDPNNVISGVSVDSNIVNGGFVGGILVGYLAGYISKAISKINFSKNFLPILGLLFNPLITLFIVFVLITYVIGTPITFLMVLIYSGLFKLTEFNNVGVNILISVIFAMMINVDFGGPINKIAFFLSGTIAIASLTANNGDISKTNYLPQNAVQAAIAIGPIGSYFATLIFPYKFNQQEKIAGKSALIMGLFGVSEGVLPFLFARPKKVIIASLIAAFFAEILMGLMSTYNNTKFVAGLGSPIGAWVGYAPGSGFGFYWFLVVISSALIMGFILGYSIERNEIIYEQHMKTKLNQKLILQSMGYFNWYQVFGYNLKNWQTKTYKNLKKLKKWSNWIRI